jgi:hypothetical protein
MPDAFARDRSQHRRRVLGEKLLVRRDSIEIIPQAKLIQLSDPELCLVRLHADTVRFRQKPPVRRDRFCVPPREGKQSSLPVESIGYHRTSLLCADNQVKHGNRLAVLPLPRKEVGPGELLKHFRGRLHTALEKPPENEGVIREITPGIRRDGIQTLHGLCAPSAKIVDLCQPEVGFICLFRQGIRRGGHGQELFRCPCRVSSGKIDRTQFQENIPAKDRQPANLQENGTKRGESCIKVEQFFKLEESDLVI